MTRYGAHSHKKNGSNDPRCAVLWCKNVFLLSMQYNLLATYSALIWTIFEARDAYTGEKFANFCPGDFLCSKIAQNIVMYSGVLPCADEVK